MQTRQRGIILTIILVIIAAILTLTLIGFFRTERAPGLLHVSLKSLLHEPCGITVDEPDPNDSVSFPLTMKGYINGCGWEPRDGFAGTVILFASTGFQMTPEVPLLLPPQDDRTPYYFEGKMNIVPSATIDKGRLLFQNNRGNGLEPKTFEVPIKFK